MLRLLALCQLPPVHRGAPREEAARPAGGRPRLWLALWLTCGVWAGLPGGLAAELLPAEVGVLASDKGRESGQLARYYMQARGIPAENLLLLDVPAGEALSRDLWDRRVRPAIRKWLLSRDRTRPIRCLVTMYDVPLRIGGLPKEAPALRESEQFLESATQKCRAEVVATAEALERVLNDDPQTLATPAADASPADLGKYLDGPLQRALVRIQERARSEPNSPAVPSAMRRLELLHMTAAGLSGSLRQLESQAPAGAPQQAERARLMAHRQGELQGLKLGVTALSFQPESVTREMQLLELITRADGLLVALSWATQQLEVVRKNETQASFDSELALVLWPDHGLVRWLPNPLHWSTARLPAARPDTLMVARLDGPTPEIVRRLVDDSLAIEQAGLTGKVYLDARKSTDAKPPVRNGSYDEYEAALNQLARYLKNKTQLEVVLDTSKELFAEGACPDAALYCGWYSLANYRDSFTWRKGAVAYHIASSEATTLRRPDAKVWCKKMLDNGVAATLGPTFEPYLAAFPRPDDFFPLLLTGRLTLAEVYSATLPFHSWAMTLVGDPLYTPYRSNPALSVTDLPLRLQSVIGPPGEAPPLPENPDAPAN